MAPELCRPPTERLSHESDVWAFGCVILEITSGDLPWINQFEKDEPLFYALQDDGTRQGPIFAHVCATQKAPTKLRELLCLCCTWSKKNRPKFLTIMQNLDSISSNDLKNITQTIKSMPAPPTESLSRMSIRTRSDDNERRAQEERERKERRDRSEEERRRRREQERRDEERRAEERRIDERKADERRAEERRAEERRAEERRYQEQQEQERNTSQRQCSSRSRPVIYHGDSSDDDNGGGGMMMPFGGGGMMTPFGGGGGGGGGINLSGGFARPQALMGNGLPAGNQYTGQIYASRGAANGRPLIQGPRGGTYYVTPSGGKRYV
jgi:serine/threonine protein kinase